MLLKTLEIKGFKSFGDKTLIHFDKGVTGIVGPNGCGKSNVVDAIRWVLGEQSTKSLRSDKMENVIFNGTKNRKPLQMAEVSLSFENNRQVLPSEYTQITICRRYYRSGEGEYLLNGVVCRLKDIQNLFLDTGIGSDSYSIIELKMVDDILNDNNHSRRQLFEEAAGISKFKQRKKETLKKFRETDEDLERVLDLLVEIEKNLKSLEKQAKQTQKYYEFKEEYRKLSIKHAQISLKKYQDDIKNIAQKLENEKERKNNWQEQVLDLEQNANALKIQIQEQEADLSQKRSLLQAKNDKIKELENENKIKAEKIALLAERSKNLEKQLEKEQVDFSKNQDTLRIIQQQIEHTEKILAENKLVLETTKNEKEAQKQVLDTHAHERQEIELQFRNQQELSFRLRKSLEMSQLSKNNWQQQLEKLFVEKQKHQENIDSFAEQLYEIKADLEEKKQFLAQLQAQENELEEQIQTQNYAIESLKEELSQEKMQLSQLQTEFGLLKSMTENLEGFPDAVKFLKKINGTNEGIFFSNLIFCDKKYRIAIENYLKTYLDFFVVQTEEQAQNAIDLLEKNKKGKAGFWILDKINQMPFYQTENIEHLLAAYSIIETEDKYKNLLSFLLKDVYIAENEVDTKKYSDKIILDLDGKKIVYPFYTFGGSVGSMEGKQLGRAKHLEILSKKIAEISENSTKNQADLQDKQSVLQNLKNSTQKNKLIEIQQKVTQLQQQVALMHNRQEQLHELIRQNQEKESDLQEQIAEQSQKIQELSPEVEQTQHKLATLQEQLEETKENLQAKQRAFEQKSNTFNQQNLVFFQTKNAFESLQQELVYKQKNHEQQHERISQLNAQLTENKEQSKNWTSQNTDQDQLLEQLYAEKQTLRNQVEQADKAYYEQKGKLVNFENTLHEIQRKKDSSNELSLQLQSKYNELKLQTVSTEERIAVEFEINISELEEQNDEELVFEEELRNKIKDLREKIQKMGQVNHTAMEAYQEIKERYEFIIAQKQDLETARTDLEKTINEIDQVAKTNFMDAFLKIRTNFQQVFRSLFSEEDSCDLVLVDPSDCLESKIEITAKPKGKRPLTINQLSGGEKTLTATSLLFAIYLLKPAPFCIFDEVDAPLDDANIDKFSQIIRKFSDNSQFIVVTHNKKTMSSTDIMYGVTMIEQGISRVISVDLREVA